MKLQRIVVAVDESDAGRWAARAALDLAAGTDAEVLVLRTVGILSPALAGRGGVAMADEPPAATQVEVERLGRWLAPELAETEGGPKVTLAITHGVPSIEICRYAEEVRAPRGPLGPPRRSGRSRSWEHRE